MRESCPDLSTSVQKAQVVTRVAYSQDLTAAKYAQLHEQAKRLGRIRSEVWDRFGSVSGVKQTDRTIKRQWVAEREFNVLANPWKETLRDAMGDIKANLAAAKAKARQAIRRHTSDSAEQKRLFGLLKFDNWTSDAYLRRIMRKYWRRGHNGTHNQIIVRSDNYSTGVHVGKVWLKIPGLEPRKTVAIPLNTTVEPTGTLRLILRNGKVEVHYSIEVQPEQTCGDQAVGIDKGYSEVCVDSDGEHHGAGLGDLLRAESDYLKAKYQRRSKLRALAEQHKNPRKRRNIQRHNLGRKKLDSRAAKAQAQIRDVVFKAAHAVVDKAAIIVAEDLTVAMRGKKFGKNMNRRLSAWTKGVIAEAFDSVSHRRCASVHSVNPAYTSQIDSATGLLQGKRVGDRFYRITGEVVQADENAAKNVLARLNDPEIDRWTPYTKVRSILQARTDRYRSDCPTKTLVAPAMASTVSVTLNDAQMCTTF